MTNTIDIKLINVPFDKSYENILLFSNIQEQENYFYYKYSEGNIIENCYYNRKDEKIKVDRYIDTIDKYNYIVFQSDDVLIPKYYCFIDRIEYIDIQTTYVYYSIDYFNTYFYRRVGFDRIKPSFVEREHSATNFVGDNLVPENLAIGEIVTNAEKSYSLIAGPSSICIASSYDLNHNDFIDNNGSYHNNIYYPFEFYFLPNTVSGSITLKNLINNVLQKRPKEGILFSFIFPNSILNLSYTGNIPFVANGEPLTLNQIVEIPNGAAQYKIDIDGYIPLNKKLFTYPYNSLSINNFNGQTMTYKLEYNQKQTNKIEFELKSCLDTNPTIALFPYSYKTYFGENFEETLKLNSFPSVGFSFDSYQDFLTKNQNKINFDYLSSAIQIAVGGASMAVTGGAVGGTSVIGGVTQILGKVSNQSDVKNQANLTTNLSNTGYLNIANNMINFRVFQKYITKEYAQKIDKFFTMYGYAVNELKPINLFSRSNHNYIKTSNLNFDSSLINSHIKNQITNIFINGVTFWHHKETFLDYEEYNDIMEV